MTDLVVRMHLVIRGVLLAHERNQFNQNGFKMKDSTNCGSWSRM